MDIGSVLGEIEILPDYRGLPVGVLGTGVPRLACLWPAAWLKRGPSMAHLHQLKLKTLARAKPRGANDMKLPQRQPHQAGSRGGREIKAGVPREEPVTQAMTIETRRAPACAVSLFPLWCKGGKHRPRHRAKVTIPVQRDQDQQSGRTEVTVEPKTASSPVLLAAEDHLWSG